MAKLQVLEGPMSGAQFDLDKEVIFVGRSPENDIRIRDSAVSRRHIKIFSVESCYFIEDLKTRNGTLINGERIDAGFSRLITEIDRIQMGATVIRLDGIGVNKPPITVEEIEPFPLEETEGTRSSSVHSPEERRSRGFKELSFIYDLLQPRGERSSTQELLEKVAQFLLESYPRVDRVSGFLFDEEKNRLEEVVAQSKPGKEKKRSAYTKAVLDQVVQEGKIVTIYLRADAAREGFTNDQDTVAVVAVICLPLMRGDKVAGALHLEGFRESSPLRKEDFLVMKTIKALLEMSLGRDDPGKGGAKQLQNHK